MISPYYIILDTIVANKEESPRFDFFKSKMRMLHPERKGSDHRPPPGSCQRSTLLQRLRILVIH